MKLLLINPPKTGGAKSLFMIHLDEEGIGFKPPLALLYIATYVLKNSDHQIKVLDCPPLRLDLDDVMEEVRNYGPDVVGITVWTDFWYSAYTITAMIKKKWDNIFVVLGGPHINIFMAQALQSSSADAIIAGDGEYPMLELLNQLEQGRRRESSLPSILMRDELTHKEPVAHIEKCLDDLPIPDRTLLDLTHYSSLITHNSHVTTMITSRGCPHRCTFCKMTYQNVVCRSAESVIDEFKVINKLGIKEVEIYDDTFTWSKKRVIDICKGLIENDINITWAVRDRVSNSDIDCLHWMRKAGCNRIHYGIESGSESILKGTKKGITIKQARNAISIAKAEKFTVLSYFMMGFPGETRDDVLSSIRLAVELDTDYCEFAITIPYPGTALYEDALKSGIIPYDFWGEFSKNPSAHFEIPYVIEGELKLKDLIELRNYASRRFYFRPRYVWKEIKKLKNLGEFKRKLGMAITLFKMNLGAFK